MQDDIHWLVTILKMDQMLGRCCSQCGSIVDFLPAFLAKKELRE